MPKEFCILEGNFSIHKFAKDEAVPELVFSGNHFWIGRTNDELSVVCKSSINLKSSNQDHSWSVIKLIGPFDLSSIGVISEISAVLAEEKISIFVQSTYDTDYILVKNDDIEKAVNALLKIGYRQLM